MNMGQSQHETNAADEHLNRGEDKSGNMSGNRKLHKKRLEIGISFRDLRCIGSSCSTHLQTTVGSYLYSIPRFLLSRF